MVTRVASSPGTGSGLRVHDQVPSARVVVVQVAPLVVVTVMVVPASAVPLRLVLAGVVTVARGVGARVSTVTDTAPPVVVFPAVSVMVGVTLWVPSTYVVVVVQVTLVPVAGVGVQVNPGMVTVSPTWVVMITAGVLSLVR